MTLLVERVLKESVEAVDWIDLAQVTEKWRPLVNSVVNLKA